MANDAKTQLDRKPLQSAQLHNSWGIDLTFHLRFLYFQSDDEIDDNEDVAGDVDDVEEEEEKEDQDDISSHMFAFPIR